MHHRTKRSPNRHRIVGGDEALSPIPWQVHVHTSDKFERNQVCGGTILDEETILSAAHCFHPLGSIDNNDYIEAGIRLEKSSSGQIVLVQEIINHPNFDDNTKDNDIAILKLKTHLTFNENVQPACLPKPSFAAEETGEMSVTSGWGRTSSRKYLQFEVILTLQSLIFSRIFSLFVTLYTFITFHKKFPSYKPNLSYVVIELLMVCIPDCAEV